MHFFLEIGKLEEPTTWVGYFQRITTTPVLKQGGTWDADKPHLTYLTPRSLAGWCGNNQQNEICSIFHVMYDGSECSLLSTRLTDLPLTVSVACCCLHPRYFFLAI